MFGINLNRGVNHSSPNSAETNRSQTQNNMHTPTKNVRSTHGFSVAVTQASTNGASVDCQGYEDAKAIFYANPSGAGTTIDCKLQESSDNAAWTDVPTASFTQATTAGGAKLLLMDVKLSKRNRYLRLVVTCAGGAAAGQTYGLIELYNARYRPVAQDNTAKSV